MAPVWELESETASIADFTTRFPRASALPLRRRAALLSREELRRRLWHFFPGVLAFGMTQTPHTDPIDLGPLTAGVVLGLGLIIWGAIRFHHTFRRDDQESPLVMAFGYALPIIALLYLCREQMELALAATAIIAFGDGSATLLGLLLGGPKLPWNPDKSVVGTTSFIVLGTLAASSVYWIEANPAVHYSTALTVTAPAAVGCALLESLRWRINDNAVVGLAAAALLVITHSLLLQ